ncbi:DUF4145 domain-containing protein [Alteromonas flava]|uniref:DUF4145 domain-containing protein n=1 Tax=Alteromonas flava TaxID=2048003 RepID=UPI000C28F118|nr:DUF4145 domain-containing protein [Alteromonas flava]
MPTCVADCPRCGANKITFDTSSFTYIGKKYNWQRGYEVFSVCRSCHKPTLFNMYQTNNQYEIEHLFKNEYNPDVFQSKASLNDVLDITGYVSMKDMCGIECPLYTPQNLEDIFNEATACYAISCYNASVAMFRLCLDLDTKPIAEANNIKGTLNRRLIELFKQKHLPAELEELSHCIRENGNDGAHDGTVTQLEAEDVMDFTISYLETRYTMPERIRLRREDRNNRHAAQKDAP